MCMVVSVVAIYYSPSFILSLYTTVVLYLYTTVVHVHLYSTYSVIRINYTAHILQYVYTLIYHTHTIQP